MEYKSEVAIMQALGIDTWRNLSKDKVVRFAAMMPKMAPELAMKIIEQYPEFKEQVLKGLQVIKKSHESTLASNEKSQKQAFATIERTMEMLQGELDKENVSSEDKRFLVENYMETTRMAVAKDSENKKFLDTMFGKVVAGVGLALAASAVFVGGQLIGEIGTKDTDDGAFEA